jgi:NAD(P)-dependent dehydrogenase (short-subunit alcohol dehydrogenase family)
MYPKKMKANLRFFLACGYNPCFRRKFMKRTTVIVGANGNLGRVVCGAFREAGWHVDSTWTENNHPDATKEASYVSLPEFIHAGIYLAGTNIVKPTQELTRSEWEKVMCVNLTGAFLFARGAYEALRKAHGIFIVISSIAVTHPYPGRAAYAASKAGLEGLVRALAVEWGSDGIATYCIRLGHLAGLMKSAPGNPLLLQAVQSNTPSGQLILPEDVASFLVWLASENVHSSVGPIINFDPAYTINRWPLPTS